MALLQRGERRDLILGRHDGLALGRDVDVRSGRERFAPVAHRASVIEALCGAERADRFGVVEAEREHHALIEIALGAGVFRRYRSMVVAHAVEQRRAGAGNEGFDLLFARIQIGSGRSALGGRLRR